MRITHLVAALVGLATRRPALVVAACGLLAGLAVLALPSLQLRGGVYELFPRRVAPTDDLATFARTFGSTDELVVLVEGDRKHPQPVRDTAAWLRKALAQSSLVEHVVEEDSAALVRDVAPHLFSLLDDDDWAIARRKLTDELQQSVTKLRGALLAPLAPDTRLVAVDPLGLLRPAVERWRRDSAAGQGHAGVELLVARPTRPASEIAFCERLDKFLDGLIARRPHHDVTIQLTGAYRYALFFSRMLRRDLMLSSGVALLVATLFFAAFFRRLRLLALAVVTGGLAVLMTLAIAAVTVGGLNALSLAFAAICIGLGIDAVIHVVTRCRRITDADQGERLRRGIGALAPALLAATMTTVVAFGCFGLSRFGGIADTGLLAAVGLTISVLLTLLLFPALALLTGALGRAVATDSDRGLDRFFGRMAAFVSRRPVAVLGFGVLALAATAVVGLPKLYIEGNLRAAIPADLPPVRADRAISAAFSREGQRSDRVIVLARAADADRALQQTERVARVAARLRSEGQISGFETIAHLVPSLQTQRRRLARLRAIDPGRVAARLRAALSARGLRPEAFSAFFEALERPRLVAADRLPPRLAALAARSLVTNARHHRERGALAATVLHPRSAGALPTIVAAMSALSKSDATVSATGASIVGPVIAKVLRGDLLQMSALTVVAVLAILIWVLRRPWPVVATCLSLSITALLFCSLLPLFGLRLDLYTIMIIPLLVGYGVDDHIYIVRHWLDEGPRVALMHSGRAVLATTLTSGGALGALVVCQVDGLRALGLAAMLGLSLGLLGSLVLLPALLSLRSRMPAQTSRLSSE